jgi:hypothetical protein
MQAATVRAGQLSGGLQEAFNKLDLGLAGYLRKHGKHTASPVLAFRGQHPQPSAVNIPAQHCGRCRNRRMRKSPELERHQTPAS